MDLHITVRRLRQRVKAFFDSHNSDNRSSISEVWTESAKYAAQTNMLKEHGIDYRHYHCYYICKDRDLIETRVPCSLELLKSGYQKLKDKLPSSIKDYYSKKDSKVKEPNFTKVLINSFRKQPNFENFPVSDKEKYDKKCQICHFVLSQFCGYNQDSNNHLAKFCDDYTILKISQTIFNTFYGSAQINSIMESWKCT